jgi:uncharacterized repeat protein (TIGR03806 family)
MHDLTSYAVMRRRLIAAELLVIAAVLLAVISMRGGLHAEDNTGPSDELGDAVAKRVPFTTSRLVGSPDPPLPYRVRRTYPNLTLKQPIYVEPEPGTDNLIMIHYLEGTGGAGRVVRMVDEPDVSQTELLLECPRFIYGLTFHPDYEKNGFLYLHTNSPDEDGKRLNQILRYTVSREAPYDCAEDSQLVIIEWHSAGHDGGGLAFGNDGMLYIAGGDGSSTSDVLGSGQDISNLLAAVLRIDVDHIDAEAVDDDRPYSVPDDNPFVDFDGARPEIWAYGLRNPFRMSADPVTGQIWVGNNGQDLWEQAYLLERGANYGWPIVEGTHPFQPDRVRGPTPFTAPTVDHPHSIARSLTGGVVYHGTELAELRGAYFYGDYSTGRIWAVLHDGNAIEWHRVVADTTLQITGFGLDTRGELLIVDHAGGLYRLEPTPPTDPLAPFPERLSDTGLFTSVANHEMQLGVVPYSVNAETWADGAHTSRYIALSDTSTIDFSASGHWKFPEGTVLLQTLSVDDPSDTATQTRRLETRVLLRQQGEWAGYSYRWNDEQTDALLVAAGGDQLAVDLSDPFTGQTSPHRWQIPSRSECMVCHSRAAEYVLGLSTMQMNRPLDHALESNGNGKGNGNGSDSNQLVAWNRLGMFSTDVAEAPGDLVHMVDPYDTSASLTARARSYLHANCQHCHLNSGGGNADFEVNFNRDLDKTALVDVKAVHSTFGLDDARLVAPGHPERSVLLYRLAKLGVGHMPQLGTAQLDRAGIRLLHDWISSLPSNTLALPINPLADVSADAANAGEIVNEILSSTSGALRVLQAIDADQLPESLAELVIHVGKTHAQETTRDLFERFIPADERIERLGNYVDVPRLLAMQGDVAQGRALLLTHEGLSCRSCHAIAGEGDGAVGPDLAGVGQKYSAAELLDTLLNPSARIDEAYATTVIQTDDGRTFAGVVTHQDDHRLRLRDAKNELVELVIADIDQMTRQPTSLMPEFLLRGLTPQQAANLLAFLGSLKTPLSRGDEPAN